MRDVTLWQALEEREIDADRVLASLDELARVPIKQRFAFFGLLLRVLEHPDTRLRTAAARALAGAEGPLAWPALVGALDDPSRDVRLAAVESLRSSSATQPARWAHALFHADPDVRRAAVSGAAPRGAETWSFYLLPDAACAPLIRDRVTVPSSAIPAVIDFAGRGIVETDEGRRWIADTPARELLAYFWGSNRRSEAEADATLASEGASPVGRDALDEFVELVWTGRDEAVRKKSFTAIGEGLRTSHAVMRKRAIASFLICGRKLGFLPEAAELCTIHHPAFLQYEWIPLAARRASLQGLYGNGRQTASLPPDRVRALLDHEVARRPDGKLDLWAAGALLHLLLYTSSEPYARILEWFGEERIVDGFLSDMERSMPFLSLADESAKGRKYLISLLARSAPTRAGELFALLAHTVHADELDFLLSLDPAGALDVTGALLTLEARPGFRFATNKIERLAQILGARLVTADSGPSDFFREWLARKSPESFALGISIFGFLARTMELEQFVAVCTSLDTFLLKRLLAATPYAPGVTYGAELALAHALVDHVSPAIHEWARARIPDEGAPPPAPRREGVTRVSPSLASAIAGASEADLPDVLEPCLLGPTAGLTAALRERPSPRHPVLAVSVALLGAHDDPVEVAIELERFSGRSPAFLASLDAAAVRTWNGTRDLPIVGHAFLHRFEAHAFALARAMREAPGGVAGQLAGALMLRSDTLAGDIWRGVARVLGIWRWRDRDALRDVATEGLVELLISHLDTIVGPPAARALVAIHESRVAPELIEPRRARVRAMLPDLSEETRDALSPYVSDRGFPAHPPSLRPRTPPDEDMLAQIRRSDDLDALEAWCASDDERIVHEAALRLILHGEAGTERLAALLARRPLPPRHQPMCDSISLWPDGRGIDALRAMMTTGIDVPDLAFHVALALVEKGEPAFLRAAVDAACAPAERPWLRQRDFERLESLAPDRLVLYRTLAVSPHPHAYRPAVEHLVGCRHDDPDAHEALRRFLDRGTERIGELRREAAWWLHAAHDPIGLPVLVPDAFHVPELRKKLFLGLRAKHALGIVDAALTAGHTTAPESALLEMVEGASSPEAEEWTLERILTECDTDSARQGALARMPRGVRRARKLRRIAELFAWGTRVGRMLTKRVFRFHMIGGKGLGYTRLHTNDIFVSPLPLLRGDRHGQEIVEALVLHEIGHHVHHRGTEEAKVWAQAQQEGIGGLLNLVADEHLERNLRATDASYGDRLKRLAAFAFQHADKEIPVTTLFTMLQGRTFDVLSRTGLGVARAHDCVRVDNGALLLEMEKAGLRFARFVRALRMGLGDRHDDSLIAEGLALFDKGFRKGDMQSLLDVSHRLRDMFGWEVSICETFGGHETVVGDGPATTIHGEGIGDDEIQREVERVLDPRRSGSQTGGAGGRGGKLILNVHPDEHFDPIEHVEKVPPDPDEHRPIAQQVARHARAMRRYLERLGLAMVQQRMRLSGRRFDPTRAKAVVLRGDPRMLIARESRITTDLFIGVIVDCSGSMYGQNMEKARAFGVLLAEAARGLRGVDLRLFGFTDKVIYDAGDARFPAVASLQAGGGNNDAAALSHVAMVAKRSRRRAKLLVMISDGLPTECSVAALKGLVRTLTRREKMCCAQVAVRPISEVCFPHYVELTEDELDAAVRRFGTIVATLVRKAMAA